MGIDESADGVKEGITNMVADTGYRSWLIDNEYGFEHEYKKDANQMVALLKKGSKFLQNEGL